MLGASLVLGLSLFAQPSAQVVGTARIDVTPAYAVRLSGYGNRRAESSGTAQRVWAKALAIGSDDDGPALLIGLDNCAVPQAFTDRLAARLAPLGIAPEKLVLAVTHTHSAPMLGGALANLFGEPIPAEHQANIDRYSSELLEQLVVLARAALADRAPAQLAFAQGRVGFAANRRTAGGPVDHDLPLLRVTGQDGAVRAIVVNYACHCTTLGGDFNEVCGDWAGFAQEAIEADHPGAVAIVTIGCGGDANPSPRGGIGLARQHGRTIAGEVRRLESDVPLLALRGPLRAQRTQLALPFAPPPTREQFEERAVRQDAVGHHARVQLARLARGEALRTTLPYPVQTWTFGDDLAMVFLGGEVVVDYALRLGRELDRDRLWVTAYANDVAGYVPSERVLTEGGYEGGDAMVYYDQPTRLAPGLEDSIVAAVHAQLADGFRVASGVDVRRTDGVGPRAPDRSRASIRVPDGLRVELVAAEPLVVDPVAIDWGQDGRLFVAEMRDFPSAGTGQPQGRVRCLFDRDGDGRYDEARVFLDGLNLVSGVFAWRDGVLVCTAPDIVFARDRDGDGVADERRTLCTGFAAHNEQALVNGLEWGLDHLLYGSGGLFGGTITTAAGVDVDLRNRDFWLDPDRGAIGAAAGRSQFGRPRDDQGNWFGGDSGTPLVHYPVPADWLARNPHAALPGFAVFVPADADPGRVHPISRTLPRPNHPEEQDRITAACGMTIYRDELLGAEYAGNAFVCEPVGNLVRRYALTASGTTFAGHALPADAEFLASSDPWFRPVQARTGPDGALWIVDLYRYVCEHPRWIPAERLAQLDVRAGDGLGRLYRVVPKGGARPIIDLAGADVAALVSALDSSNGPQRDRAHRLLFERRDAAAVPLLERLARSGERATARLQALCALDGLDALAPEVLEAALRDADAGVRRHAVRLCEPFLPALAAPLLALVDDGDAQVRLQLAGTLGTWRDPRAGAALARLALRDDGDPHLRAAVVCGAPLHVDALLDALLASDRDLLVDLLDTFCAVGDAAQRARLIAGLTAEPATALVRDDAIAALAAALERNGRHDELAAMTLVFDAARALLRDATAPMDGRRRAIDLLGRAGASDDDVTALAAVLRPSEALPLQRRAVAALAATLSARVPDLLLEGFAGHGPELRAAIVDVLVGREVWALALLQAPLPTASLDAARRQLLLRHTSAEVRARALEVLAPVATARQAVIDRYAGVLEQRGESERGAGVFARLCSACHRLDGVGTELGPDLAAVTDRSAAALLVAILDPNRAVLDSFLLYAVTTTDGSIVSGRIDSETAAAVTLLGLDGERRTVLRSDLLAQRSAGVSLMPEGLEASLTVGDMADLIAYLQRARGSPKQSAGNAPALVVPRADGVVELLASSCEIHGGDIVFETTHGNLGFWHGAGDRAVWRVELTAAREFEVFLEWACADDVAGNAFVLEGGGEPVRGVVAATGGWDRYRTGRIGRLALPAGHTPLTLRADGELRGALFDLRAIRLVPVR